MAKQQQINAANSSHYQSSIQVVQHQLHQGPLPPAAELERLEKILPGIAERILCLNENEAKHRHKIDNLYWQEFFKYRKRGQSIGLWIALPTILGSIILAILGHEIAASTLGGLTLVSIVSIFVIGKYIETGKTTTNKP